MHVKSAGDVYKSQISPFETAGLYLDQAARDRFVEDLANSVASALRTAIRKIIEDITGSVALGTGICATDLDDIERAWDVYAKKSKLNTVAVDVKNFKWRRSVKNWDDHLIKINGEEFLEKPEGEDKGCVKRCKMEKEAWLRASTTMFSEEEED